MTGIALQDMRDVAADLRAAVLEHDALCIELARAEIEHKRQYLKAHAASTTFHEERKVKEHEIAADEASFEAWQNLTMLGYGLKALKEKMHSYRQVLSAFQTQVRSESEVGRYGS